MVILGIILGVLIAGVGVWLTYVGIKILRNQRLIKDKLENIKLKRKYTFTNSGGIGMGGPR